MPWEKKVSDEEQQQFPIHLFHAKQYYDNDDVSVATLVMNHTRQTESYDTLSSALSLKGTPFC